MKIPNKSISVKVELFSYLLVTLYNVSIGHLDLVQLHYFASLNLNARRGRKLAKRMNIRCGL